MGSLVLNDLVIFYTYGSGVEMRILIGVAKIWTSVTQIWKHLCKKIIITLKFGHFSPKLLF